ncbi:MAG: hypothetical protein A2X41_07085 [Candidatus Margulisbacteria bacterium GWE2_39_32]|nr:MAG: hypothetical protein A2X41_07085 [Candidatus Margulisbacteria bacterium GWE2_39_32]
MILTKDRKISYNLYIGVKFSVGRTLEVMSKKKILIVDDEMFVRKIVAKALEKEGYLVYIGNDGKDGLIKADSYKPDLVVTDLSMPNMNGLEFALQLKKKNIPVIIVSAHATSNVINKLNLLNVKEILTKPFELDILFSAVKKVLGEV